MSVSPQGYNLGGEPYNENPFWGEGEDQDVNKIFATAEITGGTGTPSVQTSKTVEGNNIIFGFSFNNLKGETGAQGERGLQGIQGERGPAGPTGETGPAGPAGATGAQGPAGPTGATGATGPAGPKGDTGERGPAGETGPAGPAGPAGADGTDGVSPTIDVVTITGGHRVDITDAQGTESFNVLDGQNGQDGAPGAPGQNGQDGQDGVTPDISMSATADATASASPTVTVTKSGTAANPAFAFAFSGLKGETGATGATGAQGPQGPAGQTGATGPAGPGVPAGGTAGQVLTKVNGTDYNTQWSTPSSGGANLKTAGYQTSFGSADQVVTGVYRWQITVYNVASLVTAFTNSWTNKKFFDAQITVNPNYGPFAYRPSFISKSGNNITLYVYTFGSSSELSNKTANVVFLYEE